MPSPPDTAPVAILTASFGDGHNTAARGIAAALERRGLASTGALDLLAAIRPTGMRFTGSAYRTVITRWPKLWRRLYALADRLDLGEDSVDLTAPFTRGLAEFLKARNPPILISTYPLYAHLVERLFGSQPAPFGMLTMVTDSTTINRAWVHRAAGDYAVTDEPSAEFLYEAGVSRDRVHVTGFPIDPAFGDGAPRAAAETLPSPFRILYTPSTKTGTVRRTLAAIESARARCPVPTELTIVLGRHERRLRSTVEAGAGATVLGWTDRMPELLRSHHLVVGKAGGASVQEAMAAGCPMLVNHIVPGQEEGNAHLLESTGAGAVAEGPSELEPLIDRLFDAAGARWIEMRRAAIHNGHPDAAFAVADLAIELAAAAGRPLL